MIRQYIRNNISATALVFLIPVIFLGFFFRIKGISTNHSFWSDEAFVSFLARDMIEGKRGIVESFSLLGYQPLHLAMTVTAFAFIGYSEFAARITPVIFGTIGIILAFFLTARLSNKSAGILAAFCYAFFYINLANSTQAKPYAAVQSLFLAILYLITTLQPKKSSLKTHLLIVLLAAVATLFHTIGILILIPYGIYVWLTFKNNFRTVFRHPSKMIIIVAGTVIFIGCTAFVTVLSRLLDTGNGNIFMPYNHLVYVKNLFLKQYFFFSVSAFFGYIFLLSRWRRFAISIGIMLALYIYVWTFKQYTHNLRYLVPFFGIFIVLLSVFWGYVGEKLFANRSWVACGIIILVLLVSGEKIARRPHIYYNPNMDFYGDVQIANYKELYEKLNTKIPDLVSIPIFNDWHDAQMWYLPANTPAGYFMKGVSGIEYHHTDNKPIYGSLQDFKKIQSVNPRGILIVEDWDSILPDDVKEYAKKNLKLELKVEGLPEAEGDNWPLEAYSWGLR